MHTLAVISILALLAIGGAAYTDQLLTSQQVRIHVYSIVDRIRLNVPVIAQAEVHRRAQGKVVGVI